MSKLQVSDDETSQTALIESDVWSVEYLRGGVIYKNARHRSLE